MTRCADSRVPDPVNVASHSDYDGVPLGTNTPSERICVVWINSASQTISSRVASGLDWKSEGLNY